MGDDLRFVIYDLHGPRPELSLKKVVSTAKAAENAMVLKDLEKGR